MKFEQGKQEPQNKFVAQLMLAKTRLEICMGQFQGCEDGEHEVSLAEIPDWLDEMQMFLKHYAASQPLVPPPNICGDAFKLIGMLRSAVACGEKLNKDDDAEIVRVLDALRLARNGEPLVPQQEPTRETSPTIQTCTRQAPHVCKVNGPCNGWPTSGMSDPEDNYVAYCRYTERGTIVTCDSDAPKAFRVYRHPSK